MVFAFFWVSFGDEMKNDDMFFEKKESEKGGGPGQKAPGAFGTPAKIQSVNFVRNNLGHQA